MCFYKGFIEYTTIANEMNCCELNSIGVELIHDIR